MELEITNQGGNVMSRHVQNSAFKLLDKSSKTLPAEREQDSNQPVYYLERFIDTEHIKGLLQHA